MMEEISWVYAILRNFQPMA